MAGREPRCKQFVYLVAYVGSKPGTKQTLQLRAKKLQIKMAEQAVFLYLFKLLEVENFTHILHIKAEILRDVAKAMNINVM